MKTEPEANPMMKDMKELPVAKLPCARCAHMRQPTSEHFAKNNVICGWWEKMAANAPIRGGLQLKVSEAASSIPRKSVYDGPFSGVAVCKTFEEMA